jgi:hypothetical protein
MPLSNIFTAGTRDHKKQFGEEGVDGTISWTVLVHKSTWEERHNTLHRKLGTVGEAQVGTRRGLSQNLGVNPYHGVLGVTDHSQTKK